MNNYIVFAILLSALITFLLRAFPFILFKEKQLPDWLNCLGKTLPMTIMAVLIVYCLKDLKGNFTELFLPYLLAIVTVVFTYHYKKNTFLSIILSTVVYMILIHL